MSDGYLRFADEYVEPILNGDKRGTLRYEFDRDLQAGDRVALLNESGYEFAVAKIVAFLPINLRNVVHMGFEHLHPDGAYESVDELVETLRRHYGHQDFGGHTVVDMIAFAVVEPERATVKPPIADGVEQIAGVPVVTGGGDA